MLSATTPKTTQRTRPGSTSSALPAKNPGMPAQAECSSGIGAYTSAAIAPSAR
ncbi:hypothetical protein ACVDFE_37765 [Lentzea chajnantorensis]